MDRCRSSLIATGVFYGVAQGRTIGEPTQARAGAIQPTSQRRRRRHREGIRTVDPERRRPGEVNGDCLGLALDTCGPDCDAVHSGGRDLCRAEQRSRGALQTRAPAGGQAGLTRAGSRCRPSSTPRNRRSPQRPVPSHPEPRPPRSSGRATRPTLATSKPLTSRLNGVRSCSVTRSHQLSLRRASDDQAGSPRAGREAVRRAFLRRSVGPGGGHLRHDSHWCGQ